MSMGIKKIWLLNEKKKKLYKIVLNSVAIENWKNNKNNNKTWMCQVEGNKIYIYFFINFYIKKYT